MTYPKLNSRTETVSAKKINSNIGISLEPGRMSELLTKMCLSTIVAGDQLTVTIPPTRADVLHPADIYEDVAIAHGYNNIVKTIPRTLTVAKQLPVNKLTDQLREATAQAGFTEVSVVSTSQYIAKVKTKMFYLGTHFLAVLKRRCGYQDEEEDRGYSSSPHLQPEDTGVPGSADLAAAGAAEDRPG